MTKKILGLTLGLVMFGGGAALAGGDEHKTMEKQQSSTQTTTEEQATGGSGQMGSQMGSMGKQELSGEVVKAQKNSVFLKSDDGAIVELQVDKTTTFPAQDIKSSTDLKEGQQVRASFEAKGTKNIAKSIQSSQGTGGSGFEQEPQPLPSEPMQPNQPSQPSEPSQPSQPLDPNLEY